MTTVSLLVVAFTLCFSARNVHGHGYMLSPVNRASIWRVDPSQPINYNDNELFCGGTYVQYDLNDGKCGVCGDDYREEVPRRHENGGTFGRGIVVANYSAGSVITVTSMITANHLGSLYFSLCQLQNYSEPETEDCFQELHLANGATHYEVGTQLGAVNTRVRLPTNITCDRCVLRWHYRTGNSWGLCDDGTQNMGCGNQEIFRSCADITILPGNGEDQPDEDYDYNESDEDADNSESDEDDNNSGADEDESVGEDDTQGLQPCLLQGILYPLNPHDPKSRKNSH